MLFVLFTAKTDISSQANTLHYYGSAESLERQQLLAAERHHLLTTERQQLLTAERQQLLTAQTLHHAAAARDHLMTTQEKQHLLATQQALTANEIFKHHQDMLNRTIINHTLSNQAMNHGYLTNNHIPQKPRIAQTPPRCSKPSLPLADCLTPYSPLDLRHASSSASSSYVPSTPDMFVSPSHYQYPTVAPDFRSAHFAAVSAAMSAAETAGKYSERKSTSYPNIPQTVTPPSSQIPLPGVVDSRTPLAQDSALRSYVWYKRWCHYVGGDMAPPNLDISTLNLSAAPSPLYHKLLPTAYQDLQINSF